MTYLLNDKSKHLHLQHKSLIFHYLKYCHILHFHHHISGKLSWLEECNHIGCLCYNYQLCNYKQLLHPKCRKSGLKYLFKILLNKVLTYSINSLVETRFSWFFKVSSTRSEDFFCAFNLIFYEKTQKVRILLDKIDFYLFGITNMHLNHLDMSQFLHCHQNQNIIQFPFHHIVGILIHNLTKYIFM